MKNRKSTILTVIAIVTLVASIAGATYAYFQAQGDTSKSTSIKVGTSTTDTLTFSVGNAISITADQTSFGSGKTSAVGSTTATATLTANNSTNSATYNYYVYLDISDNGFEYTQNESTPELLLTVTGPSGNVTSLDGLTYKTVTDNKGTSISGFDVTTKSGLITIANNKAIVAGTSSTAKTATTNEKWTLTLTFVNYNKDQTKNAGKSLNAKIMIQQEKIEQPKRLAEYVISQYGGTQGNNNIYYHTSSLSNSAGDNSYRYAGANPNNYVCMANETTCSDANLFRIIGVFGDQAKLIRAKSVGGMAWESNGENTWSTSSLKTYLNGTYLTSISSFSSKIATATWKVGGVSTVDVTPATMYTNEMNSSATGTDNLKEVTAKIGLMYASDYGFAASPSAWTRKVGYGSGNGYGNSAVTSVNWLYLGSTEWLVSRSSSNSLISLNVSSSGYVYLGSRGDVAGVTNAYSVRPVFYLDSSVTYSSSSGDGSQTSPIRIG